MAWFTSAAGQALLASEAGCVADALHQRPGQPLLWLGPHATPLPGGATTGVLLRLHPAPAAGYTGGLRCGLPLPLANDCCATIVVQHAGDIDAAATDLLEECTRVLLPGGWMWLLALNPLSPYRLRWRGQGLSAREPITWRHRLRAAGLAPEAVSQGVGPRWDITAATGEQDGAGLRAAFLLRAQKRVHPLTPVRQPRPLGWQTGTPA